MKVTKLTSSEIELKLIALNAKGPVEWRFENDGLTANLVFQSFPAVFVFMAKVAEVINRLDHHPDWRNLYNKLDVRLSTHSVGGVSRLDFEMAEHMAAFMRG
ncbi:MAG: 4a-hydroxytetrahydrobiopterin dehydratase [Planctomycetota bacterium]|jgi:4a-hydroxytetrahydrobiopterin dehydratase